MTPVETFGWGFGGSIGLEVALVASVFYSRTIRMPERYGHPAFYFWRLILACVAGGLAVAYGIDKPIVAVNIGAAAPVILNAFARGFRDEGG